MKRISPIPTAILFCVALLVSAMVALVLEVGPFISEHATPQSRFEMLEDGELTQTPSVYAQRIQLNDCLESMAGPFGLSQPSAKRVVILQNCRTFADTIVKSTPTFAYAWYIGADVSAELGEYDAFSFQLAASQSTAPNEQWLAQLRVNLAEDNLNYLSAEARDGNDRDLKLLVQSRLGVASIAARYVVQMDFRERITNIVETLGEAEQRRFVGYVRAAATQRADTL